MNDSQQPAVSPVDGMTLEQHSQGLGEFRPPRDFDHGEEFQPVPPRPIPGYLNKGSHARRNRGTLYCLVALGIMCVLFKPLPIVVAVSHYILPLYYLDWIGYGLLALALFGFLKGLVSPGRFEYVRSGTPFVGRVLTIAKRPEGTAELPLFRYVAAVECDHPDDGQHKYYFLPAEEGFPVKDQEKYSCDVTPGDYVTLVSLPGKPDNSIRVYGFLGLDPELEYILKNGRPLQGTSPFTAILITLLVSVIILMVMAAFDVIMFSFPVSGDWKLPVALTAMGGVLGGLLGIMMRKVRGVQDGSAMGAFFGIGFLGAIGAPLLLIVLNSQLDRSVPTLEPIRIVNFWENTTNGILRDYELEYTELLGGKTHKRHIRYSQQEALKGAEYGVLAVSKGRFGYAWASAVYPVIWIPLEGSIEDNLAEGVRPYTFTWRDPDDPGAEPTEELAVPAVEMGEGQYRPCPEVMIEPVVASFRTYFPDLTEVKEVPGE